MDPASVFNGEAGDVAEDHRHYADGPDQTVYDDLEKNMQSIDFDDQYFLREQVINVDAAVVGVSRKRWCSVPSSAPASEAKRIMSELRYDVLPVDDGQGPVTEYYATGSWNDFNEITRRLISHREVMPLQTNIGDVISRFVLDKRAFLFLTHETRVCGLVSIANINCRAVHTYLFGLFNELETLVGSCVAAHVPENRIRAAKLSGLEFAIRRYEEDKREGMDGTLVQHMFLRQLLELFLQFDLGNSLLGTEVADKLRAKGDRINRLRNRVDHPVRSIVPRATDLRDVWEEIDLVEEIIFKLRPLSFAEYSTPAPCNDQGAHEVNASS